MRCSAASLQGRSQGAIDCTVPCLRLTHGWACAAHLPPVPQAKEKETGAGTTAVVQTDPAENAALRRAKVRAYFVLERSAVPGACVVLLRLAGHVRQRPKSGCLCVSSVGGETDLRAAW